MTSDKVLDWLIAATPARPWSAARSIAVTAAAVLGAFGLRFVFDPVLGASGAYGTFLLAVVVIGYFIGAGYAAAAAVASSLLAMYFFLPPRGTWDLAPGGVSTTVVFLALCIALGSGAVLLRSAVNGLRARQHALAESEGRFRQIADLLPQIVWSTQPDGHHDYYNSRWYEFTGVPAGSTDGEGWNGMFHEEDQPMAWERWRHSLATGDAYEIEYRLRRADGEYRWVLGRALPFRDESGKIVRWFGTCTDIHDRRMALDMLETLSHELSHRIKNIFAVVTSLVALSVRNAPEAAPFATQLRKRLDALGRAHDFARPHSDASRPNAPEPTIFALVRILMEPYALEAEDRLTIAGDDIAIADRVATPVALIVHELATNASKYGALSASDGKVSITGARAETTYDLTWRETGGPPVTPPGGALGFGSRLLDVSAGGQLGGAVERAWNADGVVVTIRMPLTAIERAPDSPI